MRNEERESDEEVNSFVIMVKDDLVDQEGEGGGLLAYPENVWFAVWIFVWFFGCLSWFFSSQGYLVQSLQQVTQIVYWKTIF